MTASDVPTTTGAPDNGFEGLRFLGYPVYEGLVLWDLTRADKLAEVRPGLAESWEQDQNDRSKWIFHLRRGVKFHDGSDFNAEAVIWNLDRYFKPDSPQAGPTGGAFARARDPWIVGYRKIDDYRSRSVTRGRSAIFRGRSPICSFRARRNSRIPAHGRSSPSRLPARGRSRSPNSSRGSASH
jgi:ABC-type transport system substrate-binding protein